MKIVPLTPPIPPLMSILDTQHTHESTSTLVSTYFKVIYTVMEPMFGLPY